MSYRSRSFRRRFIQSAGEYILRPPGYGDNPSDPYGKLAALPSAQRKVERQDLGGGTVLETYVDFAGDEPIDVASLAPPQSAPPGAHARRTRRTAPEQSEQGDEPSRFSAYPMPGH